MKGGLPRSSPVPPDQGSWRRDPVPGESAARARARICACATNLITSGVPLTRERLAALRDAGLDAVQLSVQGVDAASSNRVAGLDCFDAKLAVAAWVRELELPLTLNVVLHRDNIDRVAEMVDLAERLGAHRLELANTQYLGWALANREALLPTRAQLDGARAVAFAAKKRLEGRHRRSLRDARLLLAIARAPAWTAGGVGS